MENLFVGTLNICVPNSAPKLYYDQLIDRSYEVTVYRTPNSVKLVGINHSTVCFTADITSSVFDQIKSQHNLSAKFLDFPEQLVDILSKIQQTNMNVDLVLSNNEYILQLFIILGEQKWSHFDIPVVELSRTDTAFYKKIKEAEDKRILALEQENKKQLKKQQEQYKTEMDKLKEYQKQKEINYEKQIADSLIQQVSMFMKGFILHKDLLNK